MKFLRAAALLGSLFITGCGSDPCRGMYEAVKSRNESTQTPAERSVTPTPGYDQYQKERESKQ